MKSQPIHRFLVGLLAGIALLAPAHAQLTINQPGVYVLNRDITVASGDAITITASGVTLDLGGRNVSAAAPGTGRGIVVANAKGVTIKNGKVGAFNINVEVTGSENVTVEQLQIAGSNLNLPNPPGPPPAEIGILLINTRGAHVYKNTITSVGLGIFVRGAGFGGRFVENTVTGGANRANSLLGICWNPTPGAAADAPGPKGDLIAKNHVSGFLTALSLSAGSTGNIVKENTLAFFDAAYSPTTSDTANVIQGDITIRLTP